MTKMTKLMGTAAVALTMGTAAFADGHGCAADGRLSIVGNEFPAIQSIAALA